MLLSALTGAGVGANERVGQALPVPGGWAGLARAADLDPALEAWRVLYETSRRLHPTYGDPARSALVRRQVRAHLSDAAPRLGHGRERPRGIPDAPPVPVHAAPPADRTFFLPLPASLWRKAVLRDEISQDRLVEAILESREASLLYQGLVQLDEPTLRHLSTRPDLVRSICRRRADVFSVFAGSLRIRDENVEVPGGKEAESLWEDVTGESPSRPDRFVFELLDRSDGRLAFLYHTASHLEPAALRFALGLTEVDPERRRTRFRALAASFRRGPAWWQPAGGAFARPLVDPAFVLGEVRVESDGRPAPPAGLAFWEAVFAGKAAVADRPGDPQDSAFDAAWLAESVALAPTPEKRRERLTQIAFAQRVLGAIAPRDRTDALATLRGLASQPSLVLTLDRMDLRAPGTYARALRRAEQLSARGGSRPGAIALTLFQGALALVERARFSRTLEASHVESLVLSLAAVPAPDRAYGGGVARWIVDELLPVLAAAVEGDGISVSAEHTLLGGMAGDRLAVHETPSFEWEGLSYFALPGVGERRRLRLVRERQGDNTLDAVLAFAVAVRGFAEGPSPDRVAQLRGTASAVETSGLRPETQGVLNLAGNVTPRQTPGLVEAADEVLANTLASLAYAPHLGPAHGSALLGASVARRHDFAGRPWTLPIEVVRPGVPWHVQGSLLGLDVALARLSLRRLTGDMPLRAPHLDPPTTLAFARTVALRSPFTLRDDEAAAIAAAITRGRQRADRATDARESQALAHEAGLPPWRTEGLRHFRHEPGPGAGGFFTLQELFRLGQPEPVPGDAWGAPDLARGGSLRLRRPGNAEAFLGQRPEGVLAEHVGDPVLRVAVELHARRLPASLGPGVLSLFVQDLAQEAAPISRDDGLGLARFARDWPAERFDDYVSALSGDGPLVPAPEPGEPPLVP